MSSPHASGARSASFRRHLATVVARLFRRAFDDWNEMIGFEADTGESYVRVLKGSPRLLERIIGRGTLVTTELEGVATGPVMFVFPAAFVGKAVAKALMLPQDSSELDPRDDAYREAAQELMNLFCGSATRELENTKHNKLRVSQSVDHLCVQTCDHSPDVPPGAGLFCVHLDVSSGDAAGRAWCLLPETAALSLYAEVASQQQRA